MRMTHIATAATLGLILVGASAATAGSDRDDARTKLSGYEEVPSISTPGGGRFDARVQRDSVRYELSYRKLTAPVQQAHIHFGQFSVNGGVSVFLCSNLDGAPSGTPACPPSGQVRGTLTAADVVGPAAQGIAAGELAELLAAIEAGVAYVNVHTTAFPNGEIRGQLDEDDDDEDDDDD